MMQTSFIRGTVVAVCRKTEPGLPKPVVDAVQLIENHGILGDYHAGKFVRHRHLAKKDPTMPNHRQILLVDTSILAGIADKGIHLEPGMLGENILLEGIKVMTLAIGTQIELGQVLLEVTEVRNPCSQLNEIHPHLLNAVAGTEDGRVRPNSGVLARVLKGGGIKPGEAVILRIEKGK